MILANALPAAILNHLWQSTLFATGAMALTIGLRSAPAKIRHRILLAGSLKFLVPLSLVAVAASQMHWSAVQTAIRPELTAAVSRVQAPFSQPAELVVSFDGQVPNRAGALPLVLLLIWAGGFGIVLSVWLWRWYRVRRLVRAAAESSTVRGLRVVSSRSLLEPAVFGIFRPVLVLPEGIENRLTPAQLAAVYTHELCHVKRWDNLTSALQMFIEAVFWFHPMVWWIGRKLLAERELACDEAVVAAGNEPEVYAEGILEICRFCLASPLACASGVSGADLKKRIEGIMTCSIERKLKTPAKLLVAVCVLVAAGAPFAIGLGQKAEFEVASIKPSKLANGMMRIRNSPDGRYIAEGISTKMLIVNAYNVHDFQVKNLPSSMASDRYDVEAKSAADAIDPKNAPPFDEVRKRHEEELQTLLAERFQLKLHHETKEMPVYALVIANSGSKLKSAANPDPKGRGMRMGPGQLNAQSISLEMLAGNLSNLVQRVVIDRTGLAGQYDVTLNWTPDRQPNRMMGAGDNPTGGSPPSDENGPSIFTAVEEQLGLKLVPQKGPVDILMIDHIEKPSAN